MKIETFLLERWMTTYETKVKYDLAESGIFPLTIDDLLSYEPLHEREEILKTLLNIRLGYSEACGSLALRTILASTYEDCTPDNILITTGAIEANFLLFNVLLNAGDKVVAPYPAYQQLYSVPRAIGCEVALWEVGPQNGFKYDLNQLEKLLTPQTRLLVVNTPHNPTGALLSASELKQVYTMAESVGARVLCDEAYRWLQIPGEPELAPPIFNLGSAGISVGTVSKPFGLPGLRIGWIAAPKDIIAKCWATRDYTSLSPGKLNDALAILAIKHREKVVARNNGIINSNLATTQRWVAKHADILTWRPPKAGLLSLLHYKLDISSMDLANKLANEYSVMLAPGSVFGFENYLRLGVGQQPDIFAQGLEITSECLNSLGK